MDGWGAAEAQRLRAGCVAGLAFLLLVIGPASEAALSAEVPLADAAVAERRAGGVGGADHRRRGVGEGAVAVAQGIVEEWQDRGGVAAVPDTPGRIAVVRPVPGEVERIFAPPAHPYGPGHRGVDLAAAPGEEVRAALAGLVVFAGEVAGRGWVTVDHGGGLATTYGVLPTRTVAAGQHVRAGEVLGRLGEDARHLDWGARLHGTYLDPLSLFGRWEAHLVHPDRLTAPAPPTGHRPRLPAGAAGQHPFFTKLLWPAPGRISSGFGMRSHPLTGQRKLHAGVDVAAPAGTPIVAAAGGVVRAAGPRGSYGNLVVVDHGGGLETRYAHASALAVSMGDRVSAGQLLAWVGSTGLSTGPHLHFEVRVNGEPWDPLALYPRA